MALVTKFLKKEVPGIPKLCVPILHVTDYAKAMNLVLNKEGLHTKRIVVCQESIKFKDIALTIH